MSCIREMNKLTDDRATRYRPQVSLFIITDLLLLILLKYS